MPLPSLKNIEWVTTDCYGDLIDWEKGIVGACAKEAEKDGFSFDPDAFLARFFEVQAEIMAGSYELYAEVLRRTIIKVAGEIGWEVVQPTGDDSPLRAFLDGPRGPGVHHAGIQVEDIEVTRKALQERYYSAVMSATGLLYLAILTAFGTDLVARALLAGT